MPLLLLLSKPLSSTGGICVHRVCGQGAGRQLPKDVGGRKPDHQQRGGGETKASRFAGVIRVSFRWVGSSPYPDLCCHPFLGNKKADSSRCFFLYCMRCLDIRSSTDFSKKAVTGRLAISISWLLYASCQN